MTEDNFTTQPLSEGTWPDLIDLFSDIAPAGRCWCMYWRIGAAYRRRPAKANRGDLHDIVRHEQPVGLLAYQDDTAVGWCQLTPRGELPYLNRSPRTRPVDDKPVMVITCFAVRKTHRHQGVTTLLIQAALKMAAAAGAPAIEAFPLDSSVSPSSTSTGYLSTFLHAGFKEISRRSPEKPIVRYVF